MPQPAQFETWEAYLKVQQPEAVAMIEALRHLVLSVAPDAEVLINYNIPAMALIKGGKREQQVMMAAFKNHVGFYPHPSAIEAFKDRLQLYKQGKGSVQFPIGKPLPDDLIREMVAFRLKAITQ